MSNGKLRIATHVKQDKNVSAVMQIMGVGRGLEANFSYNSQTVPRSREVTNDTLRDIIVSRNVAPM